MDELTVFESLRPEAQLLPTQARMAMRLELFGDVPLTEGDSDSQGTTGQPSGGSPPGSTEDFDTRRRGAGTTRLLAMAASVGLIASVGVVLAVAIRDDDTRGSSGSEPMLQSAGLFEDARGRIVYAHGSELRAVDPADPESSATILDFASMADVPPCGGCPAQALVPVGWSLVGTKLALDREYTGESFNMDATGTFSRIRDEGGCCLFTGSNWLSPDGSSAVVAGPRRLEVVDVDTGAVSASVELDPSRFPPDSNYGQVYYPTWSPDGAQVAFVANPSPSSGGKPEILAFDIETGTVRDIIGPQFSLIRGLAWSPDGTDLLAVASETEPAPAPRTEPVSTGLYRIGVDGSRPQLIASGHYTVAVWSPDGTQIAAFDGSDLVVMRADGSDQRVLAPRASQSPFQGLAWNPGPGDQVETD
jgi:hypothetical protein